MEQALLSVDGLSLSYATADGTLKALDQVSFSVAPGETLALVGESGSGKSSVALAIVGLLDAEARTSGTIKFRSSDLAALSQEQRRKLRGSDISIVFQDPFTSLNPGLPIGLQVAEPLIFHRGLSPEAAKRGAASALSEVGLPHSERLLSAYPHQLSGGMQQRVLIATALVCDPALIILDEPTTALDVTVEARILDLLTGIRERRRLGMLFITHNLGVVNRIADRVCVLYAGRVVEMGNKGDVLGRPLHPYTKGLMACLPTLNRKERRSRLSPIPGRFPDLTKPPSGCVFTPRCPFSEGRCRSEDQVLISVSSGQEARCWKAQGLIGQSWPALASTASRPRRQAGQRGGGALIVRDLAKTYRINRPPTAVTWTRRFGLPWPTWQHHELRAVDGVSFGISPGEVLGLVGESGSGKSSLARLVLRLIEPSRGRILFNEKDVTDLRMRALQSFRSQAQIVFQNPDSSLNPRRTIGEAIARAVKLHGNVPPTRRREHVDNLIDQVGLRRGYYDRYPHQLSGGEKQRVGIARALATNPTLLVCDEPVSALDVSVQATVLNLLADLRDEYGLSYLFISHDLSIVAHFADRIAVMYAGWLAEIGPTDAVLNPPQHPYTEALLSAVPLADSRLPERPRIMLRSDAAPSAGAAVGCPFQARCPRKLGAICEIETPPIRSPRPDHAIACHIPVTELGRVPPPMRTRSDKVV